MPLNEDVITRRVRKAFDMIAAANTVTILSIDEMEIVVLRALSGEFEDKENASNSSQRRSSI